MKIVMSNLKVERARKLGLDGGGGGGGGSGGGGRLKVLSGESGQGKHRSRAASCTGAFYNYNVPPRRPSFSGSGRTDSTHDPCKSHHQHLNCVSNLTSSGSLTTTTAVSNNSKRKYSNCFEMKSPTGFNKRRKKESAIIPPTKFLLGGNINDPLNLNSFIDEKLGTPIKQLTPYSSPMPTPKHRQQVEVLIPPNINDPLNLNGGEEASDLELNLVSPKTKKRKRTKRKKTLSGSELSSEQSAAAAVEGDILDKCETTHQASVSSVEHKPLQVLVPPQTLSLPPLHKTKRSSSGDKIVSPVIPQPTGITRKRFSSGHMRTQSQSGGETTSASNNSGGGRNHRRRKSHASSSLKKNDERFVYGNYNRYYGYRNPEMGLDNRLQCLKREWFEGRDILDIGCNIGHVTFCLARDFAPKKIIGVDIDAKLIKIARKNVVHYLKPVDDPSTGHQFPISLTICHGPIAAPGVQTLDKNPAFPNNVCFVQCDYVPKSDEVLEAQKSEYDVILCLSLTKWIHLNWGDAGLKRVFKRMYKQLRPGGKLILEAQAWSSYSHRKKLSETIYKNYQEIKLKPEKFTTYLLSKEVGFSTCEVVSVPFNASKGFRRPIQLFTKCGESSSTSTST